MRHPNSRKGLYVNIQGVAWPGAGLEIKERTQSMDDKPKLKGHTTQAGGFFLDPQSAWTKAEVLQLLALYQRRVFRRGMIV
jgi:hypothetical protein